MFDYVYKNEPDEIANYHELMLKHKDNPTTLTDDAKFKSYFNLMVYLGILFKVFF